MSLLARKTRTRARMKKRAKGRKIVKGPGSHQEGHGQRKMKGKTEDAMKISTSHYVTPY